MKIYTKTGDKGETGLADGKRYSKSDEIFSVMGEIDELVAQIGFSKSVNQYIGKSVRLYDGKTVDRNLFRIQRNLFTVNSILARAKNVKFNAKRETESLEKEIDEMTKELPELKNFILPGGSEISASLHVARAVCRRVERRLVLYRCTRLAARQVNTSIHFMDKIDQLIPYFNRLSDYLFTLARFVNFKMGEREEIWRG